MAECEDAKRSESDVELEREIRANRKFTLEEAIGRLAGPGAMKGESPVARKQQAEIEIGTWLRAHLHDSGGALEAVLHRRVSESETLLNNFAEPLVALSHYCRRVLDSDYCLQELVRDADVQWGRTMGERPCFETAGSPPRPDDPYTVESVRGILGALLQELSAEAPPTSA